MFRKTVSGIMLTLILIVMLTLEFSIQSAKTSPDTYVSVINPATGNCNFNYSNLDPPPTEVDYPLGYVIVNITVSNVQLLAAWQLNLTWDPTLLEISKASDIIYPPSNVFGAWYDGPWGLTINPSNVLFITGIKLGAPFNNFTGSGVLCQIKFNVTKVARLPTETLSCNLKVDTVSTFHTKLVDLEAMEISFTERNGYYRYKYIAQKPWLETCPDWVREGEPLGPPIVGTPKAFFTVDIAIKKVTSEIDLIGVQNVTFFYDNTLIRLYNPADPSANVSEGSFMDYTLWAPYGTTFIWAEDRDYPTSGTNKVSISCTINPNATSGEYGWSERPFGDGIVCTLHFEVIHQEAYPWEGLTILDLEPLFLGRMFLNSKGGWIEYLGPYDGYLIIKGYMYELHDVAITDVRVSDNFAYAGENISIYVDAWNRGSLPETFNVTTYADENTTVLGDEITIGTQSVSLSPSQPRLSFTTLTFIWNTTGVSLGNYTISAVARNVTQEADLTDNVYVNGKIEIFIPVPCSEISITCPTTMTVNPSVFSYDAAYQARLINIGNVSIKSTGYQGILKVVGSRNGTVRLTINQPNVDAYKFNLPLNGEVQVPLWLMFQPETYWETYSGNFTLKLAVGGTHRIPLKIVGIAITVCQNGAYIVSNETVTFAWNLTGGSWVYLEAETNLPPGWSYSVDPPIGTLFETPHIITVNITASPEAKEGDLGSVTLRAYKNSTGTMFWQFIYFASTDNKPPTIETIQPPTLTFKGDLLFNATVKDASGIEKVQFYYSVNNGPWNNQTMQWNSGDTFNSTSYILTIPHVPDNSTIKYYIVATDWLRNQTQSDVRTIIVKYDLTITEVKTSKTVVGKGFATQINVTIANQGTIPNTSLKIFVYANTTLIRTQTIPFLENGTATTLTLHWNTTNIPKGNYKITAFVIPILDETDTADNTKDDGTILVSIAGDVNGDHLVDISDLVITVDTIPSAPGWPNWNPNTDINGDGVCDISDLIICVDNIPSGPW